MAKLTTTGLPTGAPTSMTDAQWRSFITALCSGLDNVGFTRNADTGQFDPATVARPTTATYVYEMRSKAIAGTTYFLKIEHNSAGMRITLGTGTNGAGTITGTKTAGPYTNAPSGVGVNRTMRFFAGTDFAGVVIEHTSTVTYGFIVGAVDGEGLLMQVPVSGYCTTSRPSVGGGATSVYFHFSPGYPATWPDPDNSPVFRVFQITDSALPQEVPFLVVVPTNAAADFTTFQASPYGSLLTWLKIGNAYARSSPTLTSNIHSLCVRFDDA